MSIHESVASAFLNELDKIAKEEKKSVLRQILVGLGLVGAGKGAKIYSAIKMDPHHEKIVARWAELEKKEKPRGIKKLLGFKGPTTPQVIHKMLRKAKVKKPTMVISSPEDIKKMEKPLNWLLGRKAKRILKGGFNASAVSGRPLDRNYLIIPSGTPKAVIAHEIGHLKDSEMGRGSPLFKRMLTGTTPGMYKKHVLAPEIRAWRLGGRPGKERAMMRGPALGTYKAAYPAAVGANLVRLGLLTGLSGLAAVAGRLRRKKKKPSD